MMFSEVPYKLTAVFLVPVQTLAKHVTIDRIFVLTRLDCIVFLFSFAICLITSPYGHNYSIWYYENGFSIIILNSPSVLYNDKINTSF